MSRESLEASVVVDSESRECLHDSSPILSLPIGVGVTLALSDFSEEDAASMSSGKESAVTSTFEEDLATMPLPPSSLLTNRGASTDTCTRVSQSEEERGEKSDETKDDDDRKLACELSNCTIAFDMHKIRRFPPSEATVEEQNDRLREYIYELQTQLRRLLSGDADRTRLVSENLEYKMKLEEMNEYIDRIDIEAEEEFDVITRELEVHQTIAAEVRVAAASLEHSLREKEEENMKLKISIEALQAAHMKQKEIIENISSQLDAQTEAAEQKAERLERQLKEDRDNFKQKELLFVCDLDEVQRELNTQKEVLQAGGVGEVIRVWTGKVERLENELRERESIIFTQQHLINELRRQASGSSINTTHSSLGNK